MHNNTTKHVFTDMGVFDNITDTVVSVESGRAAIIEFPHIESEPSPSVIWQDQHGALKYDQKYAVTGKHQLVILCANHEDERSYRFVIEYIYHDTI